MPRAAEIVRMVELTAARDLRVRDNGAEELSADAYCVCTLLARGLAGAEPATQRARLPTATR